ncbi:MAG: AmmeMemoRadiSam system protein B [Candidatus Woesearchaeota archaeon]
MLWEKIVLALLVVIITSCTSAPSQNIREPAVAGSWYPGTREKLNTTVSQLLNSIEKAELQGKIRALIVPHAGYAYSGEVAAAGFAQLSGQYDTVIILGTAHRIALQGIAITNHTHYRTPIGDVKVSDETRNFVNSGDAKLVNSDGGEHSIEIELPFLQRALKEFEIIPMIVGRNDPKEFAGILGKIIDDRTLIVVSVDLSHYHPYDEAVQLDTATINNILELDSERVLSNEIDSPWAVAATLNLAKEKNWKPALIKYMNSGDVTKDKASVVGYAAIAFTETGLNTEEKEYLLSLARETLNTYIKNGKKPEVDETRITDNLRKEQGCFVTLEKDGMLRGCIGHIIPQEELWRCVVDNTINAAAHDSRFKPVQESEQKDIEIEISALTVPEELKYDSAQDLQNRLVPLKDGVVLRTGLRSATYLPQVWEDLPKEEFLSSLCQKAGASRECWRTAEIYTYQAQVFRESE